MRSSDPRVLIVGIGGCSRSGKSSVVKELYRRLGGELASLVRMDRFFRPEEQLDVHAPTGHRNWENARAIDFEAFHECVEQRAARGGGLRVVLLEGFLLFHHEPTRRMMDCKVLLRVGKREAKRRRMASTPVPEDYYEQLVWPAYLEEHEGILRAPHEQGYHVVDAEMPFPRVFERVARILLDLGVDARPEEPAAPLSLPPVKRTDVSNFVCPTCTFWVCAKEHDCEARKVAKQAEALEREGRVMEAMELYAKAIRMDPALEHQL